MNVTKDYLIKLMTQAGLTPLPCTWVRAKEPGDDYTYYVFEAANGVRLEGTRYPGGEPDFDIIYTHASDKAAVYKLGKLLPDEWMFSVKTATDPRKGIIVHALHTVEELDYETVTQIYDLMKAAGAFHDED